MTDSVTRIIVSNKGISLTQKDYINSVNCGSNDTFDANTKITKAADALVRPLAFLQPKEDFFSEQKKSILDKPKAFLNLTDKLGLAAARKIISKIDCKDITSKSVIAATLIAAAARVVLTTLTLATSPLWALPFAAGCVIAEITNKIAEITNKNKEDSIYEIV